MQKKPSAEEIVNYASEKTAFVNADALQLLSEAGDYKKIIDELLAEGIFEISRDKVSEKIAKSRAKINVLETPIIEIRHEKFRPEARESSGKVKILEEYDVTGQSFSSGSVKDFLNYFRVKFEMLSEILMQHPGMSPKSISSLHNMRIGSEGRKEFDVIGMVKDKWVSKKGHLILQLEDLEAECVAVIPKDDLELTRIAGNVLPDNVICVRAVKGNQGMIIAKGIVFPEVPQREFPKIENEASIAVTADVHMGSKLFLEESFRRFLAWINGSIGSEKEAERAGKIKYLVFAGDNVDGVGIYPEQFDELGIKDIYEQYAEFEKLIMQIPEYVEIIICPGQHDAVRRADPQPAIPKEFVPNLSKMSNVHFVGSPGWFEIEGLKCLVYHGASLHDLISSVTTLSSAKPEKVMVEILKRRDLMPTYGLRQPYVPEKKDFMVMKEVPDLYFGGDMHHVGYERYRGTTVVNAGTWQSQTPYQLNLGHIPTPGIVPTIDLRKNSIREAHFIGQELQGV